MNSNIQTSVVNVVNANAREVNILAQQLEEIQTKLGTTYQVDFVTDNSNVEDTINSINRAIIHNTHLLELLNAKLESMSSS